MHQIIVIKKYNRYISAVADDFDIKELAVSESDPESVHFNLGDIIVGRVENVVKNISSMFVEIFPGIKAYLQYTPDMPVIYANGKSGGVPCENDLILVQIKKEPTKTKPYSVTTELSLIGRYVILKPFVNKVHISRQFKEGEGALRAELIETCEGFLKETGCGSIIRTNASSIGTERLKQTLEDSYATYMKAVNLGVHGVKYQRVYKAIPDYMLPLRDSHGEIDKITTDDKDAYDEIKEYLTEAEPESLTKLTFYEDDMIGLDALYSISTCIERALDKRVWLKSGGFLIIDPVEAMTVIDVNSGGAVKGKRSAVETFMKVNLEAVNTIAEQIRLRNLSGIIIIDFIDVPKEREAELVSAMELALKDDSGQARVVDITGLGLMELTRRRTGRPIYEKMKMGSGTSA